MDLTRTPVLVAVWRVAALLRRLGVLLAVALSVLAPGTAALTSCVLPLLTTALLRRRRPSLCRWPKNILAMKAGSLVLMGGVAPGPMGSAAPMIGVLKRPQSALNQTMLTTE